MDHLNQQLETARDHLNALRLEASHNRELQLLSPRFSLRRRLAHALRTWAANLEPEAAKTSTAA